LEKAAASIDDSGEVLDVIVAKYEDNGDAVVGFERHRSRYGLFWPPEKCGLDPRRLWTGDSGPRNSVIDLPGHYDFFGGLARSPRAGHGHRIARRADSLQIHDAVYGGHHQKPCGEEQPGRCDISLCDGRFDLENPWFHPTLKLFPSDVIRISCVNRPAPDSERLS
jgi:hypothetical protein